jgi:putative ABC transport system permease protein
MDRKALSTFYIALNNLNHHPFRTVSLIALVAVTAFLISGGTLLGVSLQSGVDSTRQRLGADAMIVPLGAERDIEGALLQGKPGTFYLRGDTARRLQSADGVERASAQLFIATFDSEHCAFPLQIIGYDPETDFVVAPWLAAKVPGGPGYGEVIMGSDINLAVGKKLLLFGSDFQTIGRLEKTGMGFDVSVFVNMETARALVDEYRSYVGAIPVPDDTGAVSAVMVDIAKGYETAAFAKNLRENFRNDSISIVLPQAMIDSLGRNLNLTLMILRLLLTVLWLLSVTVLAIVFMVALNERKREFGMLRALGANKGKITGIILAEASLIGAAGALLGVGSLCLLVFPFNALIESKLEAEYLLPPAPETALILLCGFGISLAMGPLASIFSAVRLGRGDAFSVIREGA